MKLRRAPDSIIAGATIARNVLQDQGSSGGALPKAKGTQVDSPVQGWHQPQPAADEGPAEASAQVSASTDAACGASGDKGLQQGRDRQTLARMKEMQDFLSASSGAKPQGDSSDVSVVNDIMLAEDVDIVSAVHGVKSDVFYIMSSEGVTGYPEEDSGVAVVDNQPVIMTYVAGKPVETLLDSGSYFTLMSLNLVRQAQLDFGVRSAVNPPRLRGANKQPLVIRGILELPVVIKGRKFDLKAYVVQELAHPLLIGRIHLIPERVDLCFGRCLVHFGRMNFGVPMKKVVLVRRTIPDGTPFLIQSTAHSVIPPRETVFIEAELVSQGGPSSFTGIVRNIDRTAELGIALAKGLLSVELSRTTVAVCNMRGDAFHLKPGTTVGAVTALNLSGYVIRECDLTMATLASLTPVHQGGETRGAREGSSQERTSSFLGSVAAAVEEDSRGEPLKNTPFEYIQQMMCRKDIPRDVRHKLAEMLKRYGDILGLSGGPLSHTSAAYHRIDTADSLPINQALRRTSPTQKQVIRDETTKMLKESIIEPSVSPWASPIVLIRKSDGAIRFCIDYRKLNAVTKKDSYPMPRVDEAIDLLSAAVLFSVMDLSSSFWQVPVYPSDREKTAFVSPQGLFQFRYMPFGLCNAPATMQRLMDAVLAGLKWQCCLVYMDDIIVFSSSHEQHLEDLENVLKRLHAANLTVKLSKCHFFERQIWFLGYRISAQGTEPSIEKIAAVKYYQVPMSVTDVQSFIGLCQYYRKFVQNFSAIAHPLFILTRNGVPWVWGEEQRRAFEMLKAKLTSMPILAHPNFDKPFIVQTDASKLGIGAVLAQLDDGGHERVIQYLSRSLTRAESNYFASKLEMLAAVWAVEQLRLYLLGSKYTLQTDHHALQWLMNEKQEGTLARWALRLQEFAPFKIEYRRGKENLNADALSRHPQVVVNYCNRNDLSDVWSLLSARLLNLRQRWVQLR